MADSDQESFHDAGSNASNIPFALAPGQADNGMLNLTTKEGRKIFESITKASGKEYDATPRDMMSFIGAARIHGRNHGWESSIYAVPKDLTDPLGPTYHLVNDYGQYSYKEIYDHCKTYIGTETRAAQDSYLFANWIRNQLSKEAMSKLERKHKKYTIRGVEVGPLLFKLYIQECRADSRATISAIRGSLHNLEDYFQQVEYNVTKLVDHTIDLLNELEARGAETHDLLDTLFRTFKKAPNEEFTDYIRQKKNSWEAGDIELDPEELLELADMKYRTLSENKEWNAPSEETAKILALETQIAKLQEDLKKKQSANNKKFNGNNREKGKGSKGNGNQRGRPNRNRIEDWMLKPPADENEVKTYKNKEWHWCKRHKKWCTHTTQQCKGKGLPNGDDNKQPKKQQNQNEPTVRSLRATKATLRWADIADSDEE